MNFTFSEDQLAPVFEVLSKSNESFAGTYPGDPIDRQPVHVVYGGAHLFKSSTRASLQRNASETFTRYMSDLESLLGVPAAIAAQVHARVAQKLETEAVEDFRIDFEDGYGQRSDDEEDGHAVQAATQMAEASDLPPFIGIRIKPFTDALARRAARTLDLFLTTLLKSAPLPPTFLVTLPKITTPRQVAVLADLLSGIEYAFALSYGRIKVELMIETPQALESIPDLIDATRGRCFTLHFGAYDFMTACNISGASQSLGHPMAFYARQKMQIAAAQRGIFLSDGATVTLPIPPHRGGELKSMEAAMRLHYQDALRSLESGLYQGWDLHPAQIPTRYAALYTFFMSSYESAAKRLKNFVEQAAQATRIGGVFDDAATAQGLVNYFLRALSCGALTEEEVVACGLTLDQIRRRSFLA